MNMGTLRTLRDSKLIHVKYIHTEPVSFQKQHINATTYLSTWGKFLALD